MRSVRMATWTSGDPVSLSCTRYSSTIAAFWDLSRGMPPTPFNSFATHQLVRRIPLHGGSWSPGAQFETSVRAWTNVSDLVLARYYSTPRSPVRAATGAG